MKKNFLINKKNRGKSRSYLFKRKSKQAIFKRKKTNFKINLKLNKSYFYYGFLSIIIAILLFLFLGNTFKIKEIDVISKDEISNKNIAYAFLNNIRGKSIFFIDELYIKNKLKQYQQNIVSVDIKRIFPNKLQVSLQSSSKVFNTILNNKNYIITANGTLINSKHSDKLINLELKRVLKKSFITPDYKNIISEKNVKKIRKIYKEISNNLIGVKIKYLSYYAIEREIHFSINEGLLVIFDMTKDIKKQVKNLVIFNSEYIKINNGSIVYIDLRIENKIFYCEKNNELKCNINLDSLYKKN